MIRDKQLGRTALAEETEIMKVLESLVEDNEGLKRDNAELQHLLTEAREDYHSLKEEVEEQRANQPSHGPSISTDSECCVPTSILQLILPI
jgi:regulator of replication initiation timing